jgi:hypothetical protein
MSSPLEGMFLKNRYVVQRHIATGGMAAVFLGWDYRIERPVAIKVLRQLEAATPHDIARFQREAQAAAMLNHPQVVQVYDFFEERGCCFLVMEYVEGVNLKTHLRARGALPPAEALALGEQVCAALRAAHDGGFIHRDIKPQNVLLDGEGRAKLTDFGIVQALREARMTTSGAVLGTADYIAPEQARGEPLTQASDLYGLGVVLYELLTGRLPFIGRTPLLVATQHATAPVVPPSRYVPGLSPYVEAVVLRALRKRPGERYQTAARMGLALRLAREAAERDGAADAAESEGVAAALTVAVERGQHAGASAISEIAARAEAETVVSAGRAAIKTRRADAGGAAGADVQAPSGGASALAVVDVDAARGAAGVDDGDGVERVRDRERAEVAAIRSQLALLDVPAAPDDRAPVMGALRWRRLGMTGLAALALFAVIVLLGVLLHAPLVFGRALP